jgi:hypothetical protein
VRRPSVGPKRSRAIAGQARGGANEQKARVFPAPCWCFCVEFLSNSPLPEGKGGGRPRVHYKEILSADDFAVFVC